MTQRFHFFYSFSDCDREYLSVKDSLLGVEWYYDVDHPDKSSCSREGIVVTEDMINALDHMFYVFRSAYYDRWNKEACASVEYVLVPFLEKHFNISV